MKKQHTDFYNQVLKNVHKIMKDRHLSQRGIGEMMNAGESSICKILSGQSTLTIDHLANLARELSISVVDIITYDEKKNADDEPVEAVLQIKLKKDKKDQVLKLVFGDKNIEVLNK